MITKTGCHHYHIDMTLYSQATGATIRYVRKTVITKDIDRWIRNTITRYARIGIDAYIFAPIDLDA